MGRKSNKPLEEVKIRTFLGDWSRLTAILAPRRVPTTVFIRLLIHKTINQIEERVNLTSKSVEIDTDELIRQSESTE